MAQQPRHINTDRARKQGTAPQQSRQVKTGAARQTSAQPRTAAPAQSSTRAAARKPKKKKSRIRWWMPLLVVLALVVGVAVYAVSYVNRIINSVIPDDVPQISEEVKTAPEYKGDVVGMLVCGVDYEEGRNYSDGQSNDGMTDLIMYVQFDVKNRKVNMLQIPRNTLVGNTIELKNGTTYKARNGQINSVALSNEDGMAALAAVINNNYKLPVDYYATIDMDGLVELVDRFGGIEVYVPQRIAYGGSVLEPGYHNLNGEAAEFFVRNRKGAGYETSDLARLNMQRYFYAGLFKRVRTLTVADIIKLMPVVEYFVTTDCDIMTLIELAVSFLKVDSASIMVCQTPVFMDCQYYNNNSIVVADAAAVADLLNTYFRDYTGEVPVDQLNLMDWHRGGAASSDPNIQFMGQLDEQANQAILEGNTDVPGAQVTG